MAASSFLLCALHINLRTSLTSYFPPSRPSSSIFHSHFIHPSLPYSLTPSLSLSHRHLLFHFLHQIIPFCSVFIPPSLSHSVSLFPWLPLTPFILFCPSIIHNPLVLQVQAQAPFFNSPFSPSTFVITFFPTLSPSFCLLLHHWIHFSFIVNFLSISLA